MHKFIFSILCLYYTLVQITACSNKSQEDVANLSRIVSIDDYKTQMPESEGYEEFEAACITCHSLRYIEMQPDFSRKTWDAIVHKMIKNFGSPIPDSTAGMIVDYLVGVKGTEN